MARQAGDKRTLTDKGVKALPLPPSGRLDILDSIARGLVLRLSPRGKTWLRRADGVRAKLGTYPQMSLAAARLACAEALDNDTGNETVASVAEDFLADYTRTHSSGHQVRWLMEKHVLPHIGSRAIASIGVRDVGRLLKTVQGADPSQRIRITNRTRAAVILLCKHAIAEGLMQAPNPAVNSRRRDEDGQARRALSDDELRRVWIATEDWPTGYGTVIRLLILTGQRLREVAEMRWGEYDLATGVWNIPASRRKNKVAHTLPLPVLAQGQLAFLGRMSGDNPPDPLILTPKVITAWSHWKRQLDTASGVVNWDHHDLRHTVATGLNNRLGVAPHVIHQVLGDKPYSYIHGADNAAVRDALDRWAGHVAKLVEEPELPLGL